MSACLIPVELAFAGPEIPVLVADDHDGMRRGLRSVLELAPGIRVVGEALDLPAVLEQIRLHRPRVLVLDLRLPGGSPIELIRTRAWGLETDVVATTMSSTPSLASEALRAGATGVVLKDNADAELPAAVQAAAHGRRFVSPRLQRR